VLEFSIDKPDNTLKHASAVIPNYFESRENTLQKLYSKDKNKQTKILFTRTKSRVTKYTLL